MAAADGGERKSGAGAARKASAAKKPTPARAAAAKKSTPAKAAAKGPAAPAKKAGARKPATASKPPARAAKADAGRAAGAAKSPAKRSGGKPATAGKSAAAGKATAAPARRSAAPAKKSAARKPAARKPAAPKPAAAPEPAAAPRSERAAAVEAAARSYFEAIAARDPTAAAAHWHAEGIDDLVPLGVFRGPEAVRGLFREMFASMPDMTMAVDRITADQEGAAVQWRLAGTFSGAPFQGIEPTGRRVELRGTDCLEIDEQGKVRRNTGYYDGAAFARAIGMLPPQDSGVERAMRTGFNAVTKLRTAVRSK